MQLVQQAGQGGPPLAPLRGRAKLLLWRAWRLERQGPAQRRVGSSSSSLRIQQGPGAELGTSKRLNTFGRPLCRLQSAWEPLKPHVFLIKLSKRPYERPSGPIF